MGIAEWIIAIAAWCSINAGQGSTMKTSADLAARKTKCQNELLVCVSAETTTKDNVNACFLKVAP